nr:restriction endonuclease [Candidatus Sigynarchaeota archaeon]
MNPTTSPDYNYYTLKLHSGNRLAKYWLVDQGKIGIYFGNITAEEINKVYKEYARSGFFKNRDLNGFLTEFNKQSKQDFDRIREDIEKKAGKKDAWTQVLGIMQGAKDGGWFITFDGFDIYIYQLDKEGLFEKLEEGELADYHAKNDSIIGKIDEVPKTIKVTTLENDGPFDVSQVPRVLSSLSSHIYHAKRTFAPLNTKRNIKKSAIRAVKYLLRKEQNPVENCVDLLDHLDPVEFETLVSIILSEKKLHVPAWRGGNLKTIDLIARNFTGDKVELKPIEIVIPKDGLCTFQIKHKKIGKDEIDKLLQARRSNRDIKHYLVALEFDDSVDASKYNERGVYLIDGKKLFDAIRTEPEVLLWLQRSLKWVTGASDLLTPIVSKQG